MAYARQADANAVGNELRYIMSSTGFERVSDIDSSVLYQI